MVVTGEVERGDLEVASVEVALVEHDHAVGIIVAEQDKVTRRYPIVCSPFGANSLRGLSNPPPSPRGALNARTPFRELAASGIVAVAGGVTLFVRYRGGRVASSICSGLSHPLCRVTSEVGGRYTLRYPSARESKTVHWRRLNYNANNAE